MNDTKYPETFFEKKQLKKQTCQFCSIIFWHVDEKPYCGDAACNPKTEYHIPVLNKVTITELKEKIIKFFTSEERLIPRLYLKRANSSTFDTERPFLFAGIIAFYNLIKDSYIKISEKPVRKNFLNFQQCYRFKDRKNVLQTGNHGSIFTMIGLHDFKDENTIFKPTWKENALQDITNFLNSLGFKLEEITYHASHWSDKTTLSGPSIEFFIKGIEVGNCVFATDNYNKTSILDVGLGFERILQLLGTPSAGLNDPLYVDLKTCLIAILDKCYPGKGSLGFSIRKTMEYLIEQRYTFEDLLPTAKKVLKELKELLSQENVNEDFLIKELEYFYNGEGERFIFT